MTKAAGAVPVVLVLALLAPCPARSLEAFALPPIAPADLAATSCRSDPEAGAEVLDERLRVVDQRDLYGSAVSVRQHLVRIKLYDERGVESEATVSLPFRMGDTIDAIQGRTVKPDGSVIALAEADVFTRTVVGTRDGSVSVKSFAMPGAVPGCIIEYSWRETLPRQTCAGMRLPLQRDIPVRSVTWELRPYSAVVRLSMECFNFPRPEVTMADGFTRATLADVPAFRSEPSMLPPTLTYRWAAVSGGGLRGLTDDAWQGRGRQAEVDTRARLKVTRALRDAATAAIGSGATPDQAIELLDALTGRITDRPASRESVPSQREGAPRTATEMLAGGGGDVLDACVLFAGLARAAGLDARPVELADRSVVIFDPRVHGPAFLTESAVAVKVGDAWRFVAPAEGDLPFGVLPWELEGGPALVPDAAGGFFVGTPTAQPEASRLRRTATLVLSEDGTLAGKVRIERTGHLARAARRSLRDAGQDSLVAEIEEDLRADAGPADVGEPSIEFLDDRARPVTVTFDVRLPAHAERIGRRLLLTPAVFQKARPPRFTASARTHHVWFPHAWSAEDVLDIELPSGWSLELPTAPSPLRAGTADYDLRLSIGNDGRRLHVVRTFHFGRDGVLLFPPEGYAPLKAFFDAVHANDASVLSVTRDADE